MKKVARAEARELASGCAAVALRLTSAIALGLAVSAAFALLALRLIHCCQPNLLPWTLKSAVPLILIGIAFASLQFVLPRTRAQIVLGLLVALAFILWGTEQFLTNQALVSCLDDVVVFLFVLDLSIVIYGHLKPETSPVKGSLPFDQPGA